MKVLLLLILYAACTSGMATDSSEQQPAPEWTYLGPAKLQGALKPIHAKSYIRPEEVEEKSGLRYVNHRLVFAKARASINRKYLKEVRENAAVSCSDGMIGLISVDYYDRDQNKLGNKVIAIKGLEMNKPDNDHHRRLVGAVCKIEMSSDA